MAKAQRDQLAEFAERGEWDAAIELLDRSWSDLVHVDPHGLRVTLAAIPPSVLNRHPRWAAATQYFDRMASQDSTVRFRAVPGGVPRSLLDILASATARAAEARSRGALSTAGAAAREAREALDDAAPSVRDGLSEALPELTYQWAMVWEAMGELDAATREYVESHDHAVVAGNAAAAALAGASLALVHALAGRSVSAGEWLERTGSTRQHVWRGRVESVADLARALLSADRLDFDGTAAALARIDPAAEGERRPLRQLLSALTVATPGAAVQLSVDIEAFAAMSPPALTRSGTVGALVFLARSELSARGASARRAERPPFRELDAAEPAWVRGMVAASAAAGAMNRGDYESAGVLARSIRNDLAALPRPLIATLAVLAAERLHRGEESDAAELFRTAASAAVEQQQFLSLAVVPREDLVRLCRLADGSLPVAISERLSVLAQPRNPDPFRALTTTERRIFEMLLTEQSLAEIAGKLVISINTVKTQTQAVYRKATVSSRRELRLAARRHGYA